MIVRESLFLFFGSRYLFLFLFLQYYFQTFSLLELLLSFLQRVDIYCYWGSRHGAVSQKVHAKWKSFKLLLLAFNIDSVVNSDNPLTSRRTDGGKSTRTRRVYNFEPSFTDGDKRRKKRGNILYASIYACTRGCMHACH